jgi:hypothetical protein
MDVPESGRIVETLDQASQIVERFITSAVEKQAIAKHGADPEAAQTLAKKADEFLRQGCLTHQPAQRPARSAIHRTLEVDPELAAGLERHGAMLQAFEKRLKDLPLAHLEDLRARVIPQLEWPHTFHETYDFSPGDLESLLVSLARDKHFHCGQAIAQEAARMRQEVMKLLAPYEDSLGFAFQYQCALTGSGAVPDAQSLLARLAAAKRRYQVQASEVPKQGDLVNDLEQLADTCELFDHAWTTDEKASFDERFGPSPADFIFTMMTRHLFERIHRELAFYGTTALVFREKYERVIEVFRSYPEGLQVTHTPRPDGGMTVTFPPFDLGDFQSFCRSVAAKVCAGHVGNNIVAPAELPVATEPLSKPMPKSHIMQALRIDGRKQFETWAKGKLIQVEGNRQLWQVRLNKCDANARAKLE